MRLFAWILALINMAAHAEVADCKPAWAHDPAITDASVPEWVWFGVPAVYCEGATTLYLCTDEGCSP